MSSSTPDLPASRLPIEEVARQPLPGMAVPGEFAFSPDDRLITYLWSSGAGADPAVVRV